MKISLSIACALIGLATVCPAGEADDDVFELERWCVGAGGSLLLPQGGGDVARRCAGGEMRFGYYLDEFWLAEFATSRLENLTGFSADVLWHWWGYERLDPFFTFGACVLVDKEIGPAFGTGTFWHLDDHWSLRFDFTTALGLEHSTEMLYSFSAGVRRTF